MKYLLKIFKVVLTLVVLLILGMIPIYGHLDIPIYELITKYADTSSSFVSLDGMNVHFRDEGDQTDSIPIVLIHGTGASLHTYDAWTNILKNSKRVVRLDLPAYGLTGPFPDRDYSIAHYTSFIKDFLESQEIKQCVLAGNSLGGEIAWNVAVERPDLIKKLVLIDSQGYPTKSKSVPIAFTLAKVPVLNKALTFVTPEYIVRSSLENVYHDKSKVTDLLVKRFFELTLRDGNRQAFIDRLNLSNDGNAYHTIKQIQQPTLILWGAQDLLIPIEIAYKFHEDLPNATLVILDNVGHVPMEESPTESLEPLLNFLTN